MDGLPHGDAFGGDAHDGGLGTIKVRAQQVGHRTGVVDWAFRFANDLFVETEVEPAYLVDKLTARTSGLAQLINIGLVHHGFGGNV